MDPRGVPDYFNFETWVRCREPYYSVSFRLTCRDTGVITVATSSAGRTRVRKALANAINVAERRRHAYMALGLTREEVGPRWYDKDLYSRTQPPNAIPPAPSSWRD